MSAFIVSQETMRRAVTAMDDHNSSCEALDVLGAQLYALNARAVSQRYGRPEEAPAYEHRPLFSASRHQLFKSLNCLIYQCSEGDVPKHLLYEAMQKRATQLAFDIATGLPEYDKAVWD